MTKLKSETIRYDQLGGESGNLLDDLKAWVIFFINSGRIEFGRNEVRDSGSELCPPTDECSKWISTENNP